MPSISSEVRQLLRSYAGITSRGRIKMPKLTSGITQKERLKVIQSIDTIKASQNDHERQVLQRYRNMVAREFFSAQTSGMSRH
jgi:hypothetical protein